MFLKEKGYDKFVADCIKQGRKEYQLGNAITLEQAKAQSKKTIKEMRMLCAALDDVERGDVVRLNTETPFDLPTTDFNQLLNEALDDVKNGRVERYGI